MVLSTTIKEALVEMSDLPVLWDAPLQAWTSFRIGGPADGLVTVERVEELQSILALCGREKVNWRIIGRGTNLLVSDDGFRGVVIVLGEGFKGINRCGDLDEGRGVVITAGGAASLSLLTDWCAEQGLSGVEFAAGIPGSVGGAVAGNAGAAGGEMSGIIHRVHLAGEKETLSVPREELSFSYRCWKDLGESLRGYIITEVELKLKTGSTKKIQDTMRDLRRLRRDSQPFGMPSVGSFFKNPAEGSAGRLIDNAGLKGLRFGDAEVSEKHANFLVNRGNASAADVIALMREIQHQVQQKSGILLEPEVQFL